MSKKSDFSCLEVNILKENLKYRAFSHLDEIFFTDTSLFIKSTSWITMCLWQSLLGIIATNGTNKFLQLTITVPKSDPV